MSTKKMLDKLEDLICGYAIIVVLIFFGALTFFDTTESNIVAMISIFCLVMLLIGFKIFEANCYAKIKETNAIRHQNKVFTIMSPDGSYHLDINDAHEAIQKLGYLEHREEIGDVENVNE